MQSTQQKTFHSFLHTYRRNTAKFYMFYLLVFLFIATFFLIKIFKTRELKLSMKVTDYINTEMDRILRHKTREKQNEEFKKLVSVHPLEPIRMTLTTAVFKCTEAPYAVLKRIIYNPANKLNEDFMCKKLKSPYLCTTIGSHRTLRTLEDGTEQTLIWILSEFLDVRISQKSVMGNEDHIRRILADALQGLLYMHTNGIAHLDLKIGNIMGKTEGGHVTYKLIDFGYSQDMPKGGFLVIPKKNYGTYPYKAPEVVFRNEHGFKSDVWSIGAICWFLSLQYTPFYLNGYEKDLPSYKRFLRRQTPEERGNHKFVFNRSSTPELKDFVKKCMQVEPEHRPTVKELLKHPFITKRKLMGHISSEDEVDDITFDTESEDSSS